MGIKIEPTLSLAEFAAKVNELDGNTKFPNDEKFLKYYWLKGMTPKEVIEEWTAESRAEAKAEARCS